MAGCTLKHIMHSSLAEQRKETPALTAALPSSAAKHSRETEQPLAAEASGHLTQGRSPLCTLGVSGSLRQARAQTPDLHQLKS